MFKVFASCTGAHYEHLCAQVALQMAHEKEMKQSPGLGVQPDLVSYCSASPSLSRLLSAGALSADLGACLTTTQHMFYSKLDAGRCWAGMASDSAQAVSLTFFSRSSLKVVANKTVLTAQVEQHLIVSHTHPSLVLSGHWGLQQL